MVENPHWQIEAQGLVPHWGTTEPLTLNQALLTPVFDDKGRPVIEDVPDWPNPANVPNKLVESRFSGGRTGKITNVSAYSAVSGVFEGSLQLLSYLRATLYPYHQRPNENKLFEVTSAGAIIATWLVLRADNPLENGRVPQEVAGLVRISRGLTKPLAHALLDRNFARFRGEDYIRPAFVQSAEDFFENVMGKKLLVGPRNACPAPDGAIKQAISALYTPVDGYEDIGERFGLSKKLLERVKQLGIANSVASTEKGFLQKAQSEVLRKERGASRKVTQAKLDAVAHSSLDRLNRACRLANKGLGRNSPPRMTLDDLRAGA